jgi:hypothetical protein
MPDTGTLYEGLIEQQYKDGVLVNSKSFREDGKLKKETKINKDQTVYNSTVFDENGAVPIRIVKRLINQAVSQHRSYSMLRKKLPIKHL